VAILPVIIDAQPPYVGANGTSVSLLTLPLGTGTVLSHLALRVRVLGADQLHILPPPGIASRYKARIAKASGDQAQVIDLAALADLLHDYEPADLLLVVDPRYWPVEGCDLRALLRSSNDSRWAAHAVAAQASADGMQEFVRCDEKGWVRRVRRFYDRVTWPETGAIPFSLVPVTAAEDLSFTSLSELRQVLVNRGMLSQDVPVCSGIADLADRRTFLAWQERFVVDAVEGSGCPGYSRHSPTVLVGEGCRIHPSARIVGPVVIQHGVTIKEEVTIIGPAVIGADSRLDHRAKVLQAVVATESAVGTRRVVRHNLANGRNGRAIPEHEGDPEGPVQTAAFFPRGGANVQLAEKTLQRQSGGRMPARALKLAFDVAVAAAGLIVLSPVFAIIAALIKLDSPGPIFFRHAREGKGGKVFQCLKFRTMRADAHQLQREMYRGSNVDGPQFKLEYDSRVTRVGHWLRATNTDELPQLINVLLGQMSLVGPRPSPFRENQICVPWRRARLSVRPGITGLWQVCRHDRSGGDFHQWIAYDTMYVANMSFLLDMKVLLATILSLGGKWSVPQSWLVRPRNGDLVPVSDRQAVEMSDPSAPAAFGPAA
jgi:lipopolysaccharide/colanic/teichoic acid biosynthesis glycosyltransferase